jgi:D-cysteine desulfhydrase
MSWAAALERRRPLVEGPTPVRLLPALSAACGRAIHVKQDDRTSTLYGGTKTRKLEFLLEDAARAGADALVTLGGWGSHQVTATALHARALGVPVHAIVLPQPATPAVAQTLHRSLAAGAQLHPAAHDAAAAWKLWRLLGDLRRAGGRPYLVNLGGSSGPGMLGTVAAALELHVQALAGQAPREATIVVALGSGSTAAGLALGSLLAGQPRRVQAVRVTSGLVVNRFVLQRLLVAAAKLLEAPRHRRSLVRAAARLVTVDAGQVGRGYGWSTAQGAAAMARARLDGLDLDPCYTGKAFAAALEHPGDAPLLYWHTLDAARSVQSPLTLPTWFPEQSACSGCADPGP